LRAVARLGTYGRERPLTESESERLPLRRSLLILVCLATFGWLIVGGIVALVFNLL
jgi:hypothetical protein